MQFVAVLNPVWSGLATSQDTVDLWQVSQAAEVSKWFTDLPTAGGYWPLWQVEQAGIGMTWVWFQNDGRHAVVLWQPRQFVAPTGT